MVEPRGIEALRRFLERLYNASSEYIFFEHAFFAVTFRSHDFYSHIKR